MSSDEHYRDLASRLIDYGRKRAEIEAIDRDALVWEAHREGMAKAEISRLTGLHWATVDRAIRDMAAKQGGEDGEEG